MGFGGGNDDLARQQRADEEKRQAEIRAGRGKIDEAFSQFDDGFYGSLADSYTNFARPQIDEQFGEARDQTTYELARRGTLDSSIRSEEFGDLDRKYNTELQSLFDKGREYSSEARGSVEQARADLVSNLQLTGDATGASNAALARAKQLATPPAFNPLEQIFVDASSGLAQQIALERAAALGSPVKPRYTTGLFGPKPDAVRVS